MNVLVTTSWDDGHVSDLRLAALLHKYHLPATFYLAPHNHELASADRLTPSQARSIARSFEIGAHTLTHPVLTEIPESAARQEILDSRQYLRQLTGQAVTSFCYPRGAYSPAIIAVVKQAGFTFARTTQLFSVDNPPNQFAAATTLEAHRLPLTHFIPHAWRLVKLSQFHPGKAYRSLDWEVLAKQLFDQVCQTGGVFHFWGHSWVIDQDKSWAKLERVFDYIHNRPDVRYVSNSGLVPGDQA